MALIRKHSGHPAPTGHPVSQEAIVACEAAPHRARLRRYARAGGPLNTMVDEVDLALCAAGYIARHPSLSLQEGVVAFAITREGEVKQFQWFQDNQARNAPHHDLAANLAGFLREHRNRMTWENIQLDGSNGALRPDVFSLVATLNPERMAPQVFEVKVSRADFLRDVANPEKRAAYFQVAPQVFYAAEAGLLKKTEIPAECGLVEREQDGSWKITRPARRARQWPGLSTRHWLGLVLKPRYSSRACPDGSSAL